MVSQEAKNLLNPLIKESKDTALTLNEIICFSQLDKESLDYLATTFIGKFTVLDRIVNTPFTALSGSLAPSRQDDFFKNLTLLFSTIKMNELSIPSLYFEELTKKAIAQQDELWVKRLIACQKGLDLNIFTHIVARATYLDSLNESAYRQQVLHRKGIPGLRVDDIRHYSRKQVQVLRQENKQLREELDKARGGKPTFHENSLFKTPAQPSPMAPRAKRAAIQ